MGVLHRIIQRTPTVGIENRSSTTTGHGGSSQDYPTDPNSRNRKQERHNRTWGSSQDYPTDSNSWNRKQEQHNNRAWGFFTGLSKGLQQLE